MSTQSIIVYRNPAEQAFWESGLLWPLICAVTVGLVTAIILSKLEGYLPFNIRRREWVGSVMVGLCVLTSGATIYYML